MNTDTEQSACRCRRRCDEICCQSSNSKPLRCVDIAARQGWWHQFCRGHFKMITLWSRKIFLYTRFHAVW